MHDLDERVARAVGAPVAAPPDMQDIRRLAVRHRRKRVATRAMAIGGLVVVVAIGTISLVMPSGSVDVEARRASEAPSIERPDPAAITHPLLDSCVATRAVEGRSTGAGQTDSDQPGEVFAVPDQGVEGPLAVLLRFPRADALSQQPNVTVAGQAGRVDIGERGQGGVTWALAGGGSAILYGRGLSADELVSLAEATTAGQSRLPMGLRSLGQSATTSWARSTCLDPEQGPTSVEVIRGSEASRFARVVAEPPGVRWDEGDTTFLVTTMAETRARPQVRQATEAEWDALLTADARP